MSPFTRVAAESVSAVGEERLIGRIARWLGNVSPPPPAGIGDDCAVVPATRNRLLITVDPVVYGRHFDASVPARTVGEKLLKRNLSDIAAMGGRPTVAVVALSLDRRTRLRWLERFYLGLAAAARRYGVSIVGGDITEAPGALAASLTLLGEAGPGKVLTRSASRRGDSIFVTGVLGRSRQSGHHFRFQPRLAEGAWLSRQPDVRAMIDVSDGLAKDLWAITPAGCAPAVGADRIPRRTRATLKQALADGEDYELLFAVAGSTDPDDFVRRWRRAFRRTRLTFLGRFSKAGSIPAGSVDFSKIRGYEHLRR